MKDNKIKQVEKRTSDSNKNRKSPLSTLGIVLLVIFVGIPLLIIIIALIVGLSSSTTIDNVSKSSTSSDTTLINNVSDSSTYPILTIDKVPIVLANLYPIRATIKNTSNKSISTKFDMVVIDSKGNKVCEGSSLYDDFSKIYSGETKTGEINFLGCIFNSDGQYEITLTLIDSTYNKLAEDKETFIVDYWGAFEIDNSDEIDSNSIIDNNLLEEDAPSSSKFVSDLEIKKIDIVLANLYPVRVTVNNKEASYIPKFDYNVKKGSKIVCEGSGMVTDIYELDAKKESTFEILFMGCMFSEDGSYVLNIDLLDPNYNILSSDSKNFSVDYWSQFNWE
ncbi:MAG: hypothetical protein WCY27_04075 [archaeon]|nr:hypothetical protein [Candidatus ainarchaeum sp.]